MFDPSNVGTVIHLSDHHGFWVGRKEAVNAEL